MALQTVSNAIASRTFISEEGIEGGSFDVLMRGTYAARIMSAELKDVGCPRIDLACHDFYRPTGRLIASDWGGPARGRILHHYRRARALRAGRCGSATEGGGRPASARVLPSASRAVALAIPPEATRGRQQCRLFALLVAV